MHTGIHMQAHQVQTNVKLYRETRVFISNAAFRCFLPNPSIPFCKMLVIGTDWV